MCHEIWIAQPVLILGVYLLLKKINYTDIPFFWEIRLVTPYFGEKTLHSQIWKIINIPPTYFIPQSTQKTIDFIPLK